MAASEENRKRALAWACGFKRNKVCGTISIFFSCRFWDQYYPGGEYEMSVQKPRSASPHVKTAAPAVFRKKEPKEGVKATQEMTRQLMELKLTLEQVETPGTFALAWVSCSL